MMPTMMRVRRHATRGAGGLALETGLTCGTWRPARQSLAYRAAVATGMMMMTLTEDGPTVCQSSAPTAMSEGASTPGKAQHCLFKVT